MHHRVVIRNRLIANGGFFFFSLNADIGKYVIIFQKIFREIRFFLICLLMLVIGFAYAM